MPTDAIYPEGGISGHLWIGPEITALEPPAEIGYDGEGTTFTAFSGTGFNTDNPQHFWTDALRFAIAIQQYRDREMWAEADALRDRITRFGYRVACHKDRTSILSPLAA